jgi:hypothetical protein
MSEPEMMAEIRALRDEVAALRRAFAESQMARPVQEMTQARQMMEKAKRDRDDAFWANVKRGDMQGF